MGAGANGPGSVSVCGASDGHAVSAPSRAGQFRFDIGDDFTISYRVARHANAPPASRCLKFGLTSRLHCLCVQGTPFYGDAIARLIGT